MASNLNYHLWRPLAYNWPEKSQTEDSNIPCQVDSSAKLELKLVKKGLANLLWKSWWISSRGFDLRTVISSNDLAESSWSSCTSLLSPSSKSPNIFDGCSASVFSFIRVHLSYFQKWSSRQMTEWLMWLSAGYRDGTERLGSTARLFSTWESGWVSEYYFQLKATVALD